MRVLLISDGRPGHYRQSEGVVAALARRGPVDVHRIELTTRLPLPKGLIPKLARLLSPHWLLSAVHGLDPRSIQRPDLIVSSGGKTVGANVALARHWNVPNVFSGSTRGFPSSAFRLVLTPYASVAAPPNVIAGPKPSPFDPDRIALPRGLATPEQRRAARVSILAGGPTPYADFRSEDWGRLAALASRLVREWGSRVTVVTSPRTPAEAYAEIVPAAEASRGSISVIDFRTAGPGSIEQAFDCDLVLITSDSMSMMTEAAVSRRPAIALAPANVAPNKDDEAVEGLIAARWLALLPLETVDADTLAEAALALTPPGDNHLDRLAGLIADAMDGKPLRSLI